MLVLCSELCSLLVVCALLCGFALCMMFSCVYLQLWVLSTCLCSVMVPFSGFIVFTCYLVCVFVFRASVMCDVAALGLSL